MVDVDKGGLPPRTFWEVYDDIIKLPEPSKRAMMDLIGRMDDDFWDRPRREQVIELIINVDGLNVTQKDIARVMRVSEPLVTRYKHYYQEHPNNAFRQDDRPSRIGAVFWQVFLFINAE